jgi:xanthine dehydrogenase YagT iron-sulfur-binding subunit
MNWKISRRRFHQLAIANTALAMLGRYSEVGMAEASPIKGTTALSKRRQAELVELSIKVNNRSHKLKVDSRTTLLDLLRENLSLTGSKKGCDHGQCGACTVLANGRRIYSCLSLALMHDGDEITTIEGLANGDTLHPLQESFISHDGFQCGYCTPGQIMSAAGMLHEPCGRSDDDVRECMNGNICRCGAYANIVAAIQEVRKG